MCLGGLINELLKLKRERLKEEVKEAPEKQEEYEDVDKDYENFERTYEETKEYKLFELFDSEQLERVPPVNLLA
jgi:hypothetical protein